MRTLQGHGTRAGYYRLHINQGIPVCGPCREANRVYNVKRRRAAGMLPADEFNAARRAPCGTAGGYKRHLKASEPTCIECRAGNARRHREYMRTRRAAA
ncbi:hypothetical protein HQ535_15625 [bacterium]|nr:hypothetical protein [bacterium]